MLRTYTIEKPQSGEKPVCKEQGDNVAGIPWTRGWEQRAQNSNGQGLGTLFLMGKTKLLKFAWRRGGQSKPSLAAVCCKPAGAEHRGGVSSGRHNFCSLPEGATGELILRNDMCETSTMMDRETSVAVLWAGRWGF